MMKSVYYGLLAGLLSILFYFFGKNLVAGWGWLMWFAPFPLLIYAFYYNAISAFIVAFIAYFLGNSLAIVYGGTLLPLMLKSSFPVYLFAAGTIGDALIFALFITLTRWLVKYTQHWLSIFSFPAFWTAYEFFIASVSPAATNGDIAYSQIHWLALIQISAITGIWGITFLLTLIPTVLAFTWYYYQQHKRKAITALSIAFGLLLVSLIWGCFYLYQSNTNNFITVGLAANNENIQDLKTTDPTAVMKETKKYVKLAKELAKQGATVVLFPEKIITTNGTYLPSVLNEFSQAAKKLHITLIFGLNQPDIYRNTATVIDNNGQIIMNYYKQHLIVFGSESVYQAGNKLGLFSINDKITGVAICHDLDFQTLGRNYAQAGIQILFVPALDFVIDDWQHGSIAIMRGVEGNYPVVRAAQWGLLSVSDARGRIIAQQKTSLTAPTLLIAKVQLSNGKTFYSKTGDWFAWVCIILSIIFLGYIVVQKRLATKRKIL